MNFWVFSSNTIENIRVAKERLLWGFWDRDAGEKQRRNWRSFIRLYNKIKPFDIVIFQIARTGQIHALGVVKNTFYDDQTPIWPKEKKKVLFPWRVALSSIVFSEDSFASHFVKIENYIDGYGLGELPEHDFRRVLKYVKSRLNVDINIG